MAGKLEQTEITAYLPLFTDEQSLEFTITPAVKFKSVVIRPISAGIFPQIKEGSVHFTLPKTGYYTVEFDGPHNVLHLFIDSIHNFDISENDDSVYYFGPGVHNVGELRVKSGTTVYIHRNAVVYGSILGVNVKNIKILGEGVLDGSFYEAGHLEGRVPMVKVVRKLMELQDERLKSGGNKIVFRPDHGRDMADDLLKPPTANPGYSYIGRMKGLAEIRGVEAALCD